MLTELAQLGLFAAKIFILLIFIILLLVAFFTLLAKSKDKLKGRLTVKDMNKKYDEYADELCVEAFSKKEYKKFLKNKKAELKAKQKDEAQIKKVFVLNFSGDIKASAVASLREEITAILNIASPQDEVVLRLESAGGIVNGYGLAASQLMRLRAQQIPLTICIDKVAASGGYLMASVANKILAAPFAIIGSIGVIVQIPNFHRLLKEHHVDFEQLTAGEFKRTLTLFGKNTEEGREKLQEDIEDIHQHFKNLITEHRKEVDIDQVATGEYWLASHAIKLHLVDVLMTSDDYLFNLHKSAKLLEICYEIKKPLLSRLSAAATMGFQKLLRLHVSHDLLT